MIPLKPWPLPLELTAMVISHVDRQDLAALSRVCKAVQLVAQPRLYTDITLTWETQLCQRPTTVNKLLQTMVDRADLADLVQDLRLLHQPANHTRMYSERTHRVIGPRVDTRTSQASKSGAELDEAFARLISSLSKLQHLELGLRCEVGSSAFSDMVKCETKHKSQVAARPSGEISSSNLKALRSVLYFTDVSLFPFMEEVEEPPFVDFLWLFYLPSIETIRATAVETSPPSPWPGGAPTTSSLTTLHLVQSHVAEETLEMMFVASPNLREFQYNFTCDDEVCHFRRGAFLDCTKLGQALQQLKSSLEVLIIHVDYVVRSAWDVRTEGGRWGFGGNLGRFDDFSKLVRLEVPFALLLGWDPSLNVRLPDTLPCGLHYLCFTNDLTDWDHWYWDDSEVLGQFRDYLRDETCLDLDNLELRSNGNKRVWGYLCNEMQRLCEAAGIRLEFTGKFTNDHKMPDTSREYW